MTIQEFSDQFDTLLDSYKFENEFGKVDNNYRIRLDEYEKSSFLTNAQNDIVIDLYTGRGLINESYEQSEELRRYLSNLNITSVVSSFTPLITGLSPHSKKCNIGNEVLYITQEQCKISSDNSCLNGTWIDTYPIRRDDYNRIKNNPFKNNKIWRIDQGISSVELISKHSITDYKVSYLRRPSPIILEDLGTLSIDGISTPSECELHIMLHKYILEKAVMDSVKFMTTQINTNTKE